MLILCEDWLLQFVEDLDPVCRQTPRAKEEKEITLFSLKQNKNTDVATHLQNFGAVTKNKRRPDCVVKANNALLRMW